MVNPINEEFRMEFDGIEAKEAEEDMTLGRIARLGVYMKMIDKAKEEKDA